MVCEGVAIYARLGEAEAGLRVKGMQDTIYKTREDSIALDRASDKLANGVFYADCDSASIERQRPHPKPLPAVWTDSHATDSLARLMRLLLTTDQPLTVNQMLGCEYMDLDRRLGSPEAKLRGVRVRDTIDKTRADTIARSRVEASIRVGMRAEFRCDTLAAAYKRYGADSLSRHSPQR
jgi:hypothetical protein